MKSNLDGLEIILGGLTSVARAHDKTKTKVKKSETKFTIALSRSGLPLSYVNVVIDTDLDTGISTLSSMKHEPTSHFSKRLKSPYLNSLAKKSSNGPARSLQIHEPDRAITLEEAVDSLDSILGNG